MSDERGLFAPTGIPEYASDHLPPCRRNDPHVRVVSGGRGHDTFVLYVDEHGAEHRIPGVTHITWAIDAQGNAHASIVLVRPRIDAAAMEGVYEVLDPRGEEDRSSSAEPSSGLKSEGGAGWGQGWDRPPPSYGGTSGD